MVTDTREKKLLVNCFVLLEQLANLFHFCSEIIGEHMELRLK